MVQSVYCMRSYGIYFVFFYLYCIFFFFFFFFQAEDGIRDVAVTGVQTCALPISNLMRAEELMRGSQLSVVTTTKLSRIDSAQQRNLPKRQSAVRLTVSMQPADRKSVVWGKSVDRGGGRVIKKKRKRREGTVNDEV